MVSASVSIFVWQNLSQLARDLFKSKTMQGLRRLWGAKDWAS